MARYGSKKYWENRHSSLQKTYIEQSKELKELKKSNVCKEDRKVSDKFSYKNSLLQLGQFIIQVDIDDIDVIVPIGNGFEIRLKERNTSSRQQYRSTYKYGGLEYQESIDYAINKIYELLTGAYKE